MLCFQGKSPRKALAASPRIARMIDLYCMSKNLHALPDAGGLLDQRADVYSHFAIFAAAEASLIPKG